MSGKSRQYWRVRNERINEAVTTPRHGETPQPKRTIIWNGESFPWKGPLIGPILGGAWMLISLEKLATRATRRLGLSH